MRGPPAAPVVLREGAGQGREPHPASDGQPRLATLFVVGFLFMISFEKRIPIGWMGGWGDGWGDGWGMGGWVEMAAIGHREATNNLKWKVAS